MTRRENPRSPLRGPARSPLLRVASVIGGGGAAALPSSGQILSRWSADTITPQADNTTFQTWTIGVGGDTVLNMHSRAPTWLDPVAGIVGKKVKVAAFEWYNQRGATPTPRNNSLTYIAARRTALTLMCWGTSTDNSDAAPDQNRVDYNAYFDANHGAGVMDSYVALHADANIGVEGSFISNPGNWSDIVHLSDAGYTFLASLMAAGVAAIP